MYGQMVTSTRDYSKLHRQCITNKKQQDSQSTYNIILKRVCVTNLVVEKQ
jgi:hypothetical protein